MRPQFHFTRVSPGFSLKSTPLGTSPVGIKMRTGKILTLMTYHSAARYPPETQSPSPDER